MVGGLLVAVFAGATVWTLFYGALLARSRDDGSLAPDVGSALDAGWRRFLPLLGVVLVVVVLGLLLVGGPAALMLGSIFQGIQAGDPTAGLAMAGLGLLGLLAGVAVLVFLLVRWFVAPPVAVIEDLGTVEALHRSRDLTAGHRLTVFGLLVVGVVIGAILNAVLGVALSPLDLVSESASAIGSLLSGALTAPLWPLLSVKAWEQLAGEADEPEAEPAEDAGGSPADDEYVPMETSQID